MFFQVCVCVCAIVSFSQVVLNVEEVCQPHQSVCSSLASEQAPLSLFCLSVLLSLSLLSLPQLFSLIHGQGWGLLLLVAGGDLSVMGRRVIVVVPLSHANVRASSHTHTNPHTFLFKPPILCEHLNLDKLKAAASIGHIPKGFKCKLTRDTRAHVRYEMSLIPSSLGIRVQLSSQ